MSRLKRNEERREAILAISLIAIILVTILVIAGIGLIIAYRVPPKSFVFEVIVGCVILLGIIVASVLAVWGVTKIFMEIVDRSNK